MNALDQARAYLAKLSPAISGAGGHDATFRAACCLVRLGLAYNDALDLLHDWNGTHCKPMWSAKELEHKLNDARRTASYHVRAFTRPTPAVRVTWKIERKTPKPAAPSHPLHVAGSVPAPPTAEVLPYVTPSGDLVIPFNSPVRFHWWKEGGMTPSETRRFCSHDPNTAQLARNSAPKLA